MGLGSRVYEEELSMKKFWVFLNWKTLGKEYGKLEEEIKQVIHNLFHLEKNVSDVEHQLELVKNFSSLKMKFPKELTLALENSDIQREENGWALIYDGEKMVYPDP